MIPIDDDVQEVMDWDAAMKDVISYALWWEHSDHKRHNLGRSSVEAAIGVCQNRAMRNAKVWLPADEDSP